MEKNQIVPAVLAESYEDLSVTLARLRGVSGVAHIDVCDGRFVPSVSWPAGGDEGQWRRAVLQEEGLPLWESFEFEFDLMVSKPLALAREAVEAGASRVVLHLESVGYEEAFDALIADGRAEVSLAGGVGVDLSPHLERIGRAAGFQQMGIEKIGYQGQPFSPRALEGVRVVRDAFPELPLSFDGAVSEATAAAIVSAGVERLIVGSAIVRAEDPGAAARAIRRAAAPVE